MVIWKYNKKWAKKARQAKIVDTLRLESSNPARLEAAKKAAKESELDYQTIRLVKVWDDWFVFGLDMDEEKKHRGIMVSANLDYRIVWLYTSNNLHYTDFETDKWRGEVLAELLRIHKESPNVEIEQVAFEMVGLTDERCAMLMSESHVYVDIIENARNYANIVTM